MSYLELTKPRITSLVVFTTASGLWLAPVRPQRHTALLALIGTALVVAAAYFAAALVSGALFLGHGVHGLRPKTGRQWARNELVASLGYVTVLLAVLVLDHAYSSNSRTIHWRPDEILGKQ